MKHIVLAVEGEELNRRILGYHLVTRGGHALLFAKDPNSGIKELKRHDITILIAAHTMGDDYIETESSGLNTLAYAKKNNPHVETTILIAPQVTPKLQRAAAELGIDKVTTYGSLQHVLEDAELAPRSTRVREKGHVVIKG